MFLMTMMFGLFIANAIPVFAEQQEKTTILSLNNQVAVNASTSLAVQEKYTVRQGDTIYTISRFFEIPMNRLVQANSQLLDPNSIWPGMILHIPSIPIEHKDGIFPMQAGTYQPYVNDYAVERNWSPQGNTSRTHEGIDIIADEGTPVYAISSGTVTKVGWNEYGGWRLTMRVANQHMFYYAHFAQYAREFKVGDWIERGQLIGYVGSTGHGSEGTKGKFVPHLHFGMYSVSPWKSINPYPYLKMWEVQTS
jgi:murein DD-endopeptidase MepM/ murein hydrolase activator NlpD